MYQKENNLDLFGEESVFYQLLKFQKRNANIITQCTKVSKKFVKIVLLRQIQST